MYSAPVVAKQTLALIESTMQADQGASYRGLLRDLMPLAEDAYRGEEDEFRSHLGASVLGRECAREGWYGFRWVTSKKFPAKILRLFNRGHLEEPRMIALLIMIGCQVWHQDEEGKQFRITGYRGHYGGGLDSVAQGIPELLSKESFLAEYKTHNEKSFKKVESEGVRISKIEHYVQMQQYMGFYGLQWALYMATNKNTDELYAELVPFDEHNYGKYQHKAIFIIDSPTPPNRISESPGWYKCKFCDHRPVCHGPDMPNINCRTCAWVQVGELGKWWCTHATNCGENGALELSKQDQLNACDYYEVNPTIKK